MYLLTMVNGIIFQFGSKIDILADIDLGIEPKL